MTSKLNFKSSTATPLERNVAKWIRSQAEGYPDTGVEGALRDLFHGGCSSGIVGHLIYTADCVAFYQRHRAEIAAMLSDSLVETDVQSPSGLLRDWEFSDPLALDTSNQTLLAHFGFEECARRIASAAGIEI